MYRPTTSDHLLGEIRIVADLERANPVGLKICGFPDCSHLMFADLGILCHAAQAPVSRFPGDGLHGGLENVSCLRWR